SLMIYLFLHAYLNYLHLHSFPTRRSSDLNEPQYNTYFQPVTKSQKRKKGKGLFFKLLIPIIIVLGIFIAIMYALSTRADVDELKKIENKDSFVSVSNMPDYTKGAFIAMEY